MATAVPARPLRTNAPRRDRSKRGAETSWRRRVLMSVLLTGCLIGAVLVHVWLRLQVVHVGYVLSTTSKLQHRLEQENRELKLELATMLSPDRLEGLARKRLRLAAPEKGQVIVLP